MKDENGGRRKLVLFTEFKDTLTDLARKIRNRLGREEAVVEIHGAVPRDRPALLSEAEHQALLLAISRRSNVDAPGRVDQCNWVAQRLTYCACGASMTATTSSCRRGSKLHRYRHLRCNGRRDGKTGCTAAARCQLRRRVASIT